MIFDELILHDFGQYGGKVAISLTPPSAEQPIILFGGLNGAGKTTILDAIQLCLFGTLARIGRRDGKNYEQFLADSIHRGSGATSAAVEMRFRHMSQGEEQHYRLRRSWRQTGKGCKEQLEVMRGERFDQLATTHWAEQVEEFLPARIAHLFLFDGEQIEAYADPRSAASLIETAVYNLLGLDLVEKLGADLSVIERRRLMEVRPQADLEELEALEASHTALQEKVAMCHTEHAQREAALSRLAGQRAQIEARYRKEGGHLYERRSELERALVEAETRFAQAERALREATAGVSPFLLVGPLLQRTAAQVSAESEATRAAATDALLVERDGAILDRVGQDASSAALVAALSEFLKGDRRTRLQAGAAPRLRVREFGRERLRELIEEELPTCPAFLEQLQSEHRTAAQALDDAQLHLAAVPTAEALAQLAEERDALIAREAVLRAEQRSQTETLERLRRDAERASVQIARFAGAVQEAQLADDDRSRVIEHVGRVRVTLDKFRDAVIRRHLARIEALVLDSFQQLLRKKTLVAKLAIDPATFQLELTGRDGQCLSPDRLSAGERQLLATSVLWGLARASGRPLPTVIDTPLGRLDSSHRRLLVTHYFPMASHQVILLSTDEEIAGGYFEALKPYIGRVYHLEFDEEQATTRVEPGYFREDVHAD